MGIGFVPELLISKSGWMADEHPDPRLIDLIKRPEHLLSCHFRLQRPIVFGNPNRLRQPDNTVETVHSLARQASMGISVSRNPQSLKRICDLRRPRIARTSPKSWLPTEGLYKRVKSLLLGFIGSFAALLIGKIGKEFHRRWMAGMRIGVEAEAMGLE